MLDDDDDIKALVRWRLMRMFTAFAFLVPIAAITLWSPLPLAWALDGGRASVDSFPDGPKASGEVDSIIHTSGLSESCARGVMGPIIVFLGESDRGDGRIVALGLVPSGDGLAVRPMEVSDRLATWGTQDETVTARVVLAQDPLAAVIPAPIREGSYWRIRGEVSYPGSLRAAQSIAPISVATETANILALRTESVAEGMTLDLSIDIRWLAARRGPLGLPVYCW